MSLNVTVKSEPAVTGFCEKLKRESQGNGAPPLPPEPPPVGVPPWPAPPLLAPPAPAVPPLDHAPEPPTDWPPLPPPPWPPAGTPSEGALSWAEHAIDSPVTTSTHQRFTTSMLELTSSADRPAWPGG
ncbi:MAG: hypothetical protein IT375_06700 [Polyangiaceae bacterium]|nr:hypothetical protein [Polyangiaceae bacterium]